ncbi:MAG: caspase family protein [Bacteroidia bacterium]
MEAPKTRNLFPESTPEESWEKTLTRTNFLLIVAIDDYNTTGIPPLKNCVKDAEDLLELLLEDYEFDPENVRFLCSGKAERFPHLVTGQATRRNIIDQMRVIAKQCQNENERLGANEDQSASNLLLYYSGHGWYDDFLEQGYWIPVDATLDDFSMYVSNSTIRDFLNGIDTHHTLLLADSCFSGSLFATGEGKSIANSRLEQDASRWGITAGRNEVVSDGTAGENSPFAANLLEELRKNESIGVQELSVKVLEKVAADDKQTPRGEPLRVRGHKGGQFVFRKRQNARKHFDLGMALMDLAEYVPERTRYLSASKQFALAVRLTKKPQELSEFSLWYARALAAAGDYKAALEALQATVPSPAHQFLKCCLLFLFHKEGEEGFSDKLQIAINRFEHSWPEHALWPLCQEMKVRLNQPSNVRLCLFLVAIDKYQSPVSPLDGCINDLYLVRDTFQQIWPEDSLRIIELKDEQATRDNILNQLKALAQELSFEDRFIFYYTGHSTNNPQTDDFLVVYDSRSENGRDIATSELNEAMSLIPTNAKGMILDTDGNQNIIEFHQSFLPDYGLLIGASEGQHAKETQISGQSHGLFTYSLVEVLLQVNESDNWERLPQLVETLVTQRTSDQKPLFFNLDLVLSSHQQREIFTDLIEFLEGTVKTVNPNRVEYMLNFMMAKGIRPIDEHLLRLAQSAKLNQKIMLYSMIE